MSEPFYMASVLFGDPDGEWAGGQNPLTELGLVDFWRMNAERIRGETFFPSSPGSASVPAPLVLETVTEVGVSFRGDAEAFRTQLGIDPDGVVGAVAMPYPLLDIDALDVGLEISVGAKLVTGPTRRAVLGGMLALAACAGDGGDKGDPTTPTGETGATTDTGAPLGCDDGAVHPWPTHTAEIPEALGLTGTHAAGLRGRGQRVAVVDSGVVPPPNSAAWLQAVSVGGLVASTDEVGHGTAVIEHLHATAPDAEVRSIKCVDNSGWANFPVAGFQRAVELGERTPDVVLCSWVMLEQSVALQREIANAAERDVVVVFAAGNGAMHDERAGASGVAQVEDTVAQQVEISNASFATRRVHAVAHPDALVVGGMTAYCNDDTLQPETVATAYDSLLFGADGLVDPNLEVGGQTWSGARSVPDVCGLVAPLPEPGEPPVLTRTRTATGSTLDRKPDGTAPDDGVALTAGSSMAAAHVAGVAAILRHALPELSARGVRNVLMSTASNGRWQARTGWGLVRAASTVGPQDRPSALTWLEPAATPYLRASIDDLGLAGPRAVDVDPDGFPRCPDLFFRQNLAQPNLQTRFGLTAKHVPGALLAEPGRVPPRALHLRVTNRGRTVYGDVALIFAVRATADPGVFAVGGLDERDVSAPPGELVVWGLVGAPEGLAGVLVELRDGGAGVVTPGTYTTQDLVTLVSDNRTVGVTALPGGV